MYKKTAIEIRDLFRKKEVSATEITSYFLMRIKTFDKSVKAFINVLEKRALKKAKILDENRDQNKPLGMLSGIPIVVKDNMHIENEITTCGSKFLSNYKAPFDASVIKFLEEEDAIIIGKTNLDEFAMGTSNENSAFFPTYNPWNLKCTPGGSSGGSAAAVTARFASFGLGSDTGGSIRQPAAMCGIVGFKPTYGRVSRYGLVAFGSSLDQIGPFATNVSDIGLIMQIMGKYCRRDSTSLKLPQETYLNNLPSNLKGKKVGIPNHFLEDLKPEIKKNFQKSIDIFKELGAEIVDVDLDIFKYSIAVYYILATAEASTNLARFDGIRYGVRSENNKTLDDIYDYSREEGFGAEVKKRIMLGTYVLSSGHQKCYYNKAQKVRTLIINAFNDAFSKCDFIATPTSPIASFEIGSIQESLQLYLQDLFTIPANLAGLPSISLPTGFNEEHKPLSIQLTAPSLHDVNLIKYAYAFEQKEKFYQNIPPLFDQETK